MTTRSGFTATFVSTLPGGENFSIPGTVSVFYLPRSGHLYLTFTSSLQMLLVHRVMGPFFMTSGLLAQQPLSIAYKELFPLVVAAHLWGHLWVSKRVEFCSDNMAVVSGLRSGTSRDPNMVLLCHLSLIAARQSFVFTACHTAGRDNSIADSLSRFDFQCFRHLAPHAAPGATPTPASGGLTGKCRFYLANGLASSTRQVYASAQRQFCNPDVSFSQSQPPLPASEQMLMRFCTHLADRLHHSSIKVYLSAVRSLHIDYGFSDPLPNCLQLQRLLRGIKHHQGSNLTQRQPVTADLVSVLHRSLDLANPDNVMLWAACCVGFFGFLRGGEFTVNSPFDPSLHLTLDDMQVDAPLFACLSSAPRQTLSERAALSFLVVVPPLYALWFPW